MTNRQLTLCFTVILCFDLAAAARGEQQEGQEGTAASWEKYKVLLERNIFLQDRSRWTSSAPRSTVAAAPVYRPERYIILTGIAREGEEYIAFLEDTRSGVTSRVRADGPAAEGRIVRIELDHIEYQNDGQTVKIELGNSLGGALPRGADAPESSVMTGSEGDTSVGTTLPSAGAGTDDHRAILERLRQRRKKELNEQ